MVFSRTVSPPKRGLLIAVEPVDFTVDVAQRSKVESSPFPARIMSDHDQRRRGQASRYLNGGENALMRGPFKPGDELQGGWTREQLISMNDRFVVAVETAMRLGLENRASA